MLLNYCHEYDRMRRRQNGENVHDDLQRYRVLKEMEPEMERRYAAGEVREHMYRAYRDTLRRCEELLGEE